MIMSLGADLADSAVFSILLVQFKSDTTPDNRGGIKSRICECESLFIAEVQLAALA